MLGAPGEASAVADAHRVDPVVHPCTLRTEDTSLPTDLRGGAAPGDHG